MDHRSPRLLVVAHGTASPVGVATSTALLAAIAAARPSVAVDLCFLDVATPRLGDVLDERPTVVLPLLLSTGYHVRSDIPEIVGARPNVVVARHLGPHQLLVDALVDRLRTAVPGGAVSSVRSVLLAAAGSSRAEAGDELRETARLLAGRLDAAVDVATMTDDLTAAVAPVDAVATYLLAPGQFVDTLRTAARGTPVAAPIGVHPALIELAWLRYDDAVRAGAPVDTR